MDTNMVEVLRNIKKSTELVFEHYRYFERSKGFKNTLIEVGLKNVIGLAQDGIDEANKMGLSKNPTKEQLKARQVKPANRLTR